MTRFHPSVSLRGEALRLLPAGPSSLVAARFWSPLLRTRGMGAGGAVRTAYWVSSGRAARARAQQQAAGPDFPAGQVTDLPCAPVSPSIHLHRDRSSSDRTGARAHSCVHTESTQHVPGTRRRGGSSLLTLIERRRTGSWKVNLRRKKAAAEGTGRVRMGRGSD